MGRGAGDLPTASAIVSDLVRAASAQKHLYPTFDNELHPAVSLQNNTDWRCAFYTRMLAKDEPGVLSRIAQTFADHGVSIAAMQQKGEQHDGGSQWSLSLTRPASAICRRLSSKSGRGGHGGEPAARGSLERRFHQRDRL